VLLGIGVGGIRDEQFQITTLVTETSSAQALAFSQREKE
jgi:hypothetical protein